MKRNHATFSQSGFQFGFQFGSRQRDGKHSRAAAGSAQSGQQPNPNTMRYVIISPVRDEEKYIERTIQSVMRQTIRPVEWVIVDDGSCDRTAAILDDYGSREP